MFDPDPQALSYGADPDAAGREISRSKVCEKKLGARRYDRVLTTDKQRGAKTAPQELTLRDPVHTAVNPARFREP